MRKLAREAVIFALLGWLGATIAIFVKLDIDDRAAAKDKAVQAVHAGIDWNVYTTNSQPMHTVQVPLRNGTVLQVRQCPIDLTAGLVPKVKFDPNAPYQPEDCRNFSDDKFFADLGGVLVSIPLGNAEQVAIERDYWTAYHNSRHQELAGEMLGSLFLGLWGFPAGLGLWIFYRLVRFAVKG